MKYFILEKAYIQPYTRTRKGKFERVSGYTAAREIGQLLYEEKQKEWTGVHEIKRQFSLKDVVFSEGSTLDHIKNASSNLQRIARKITVDGEHELTIKVGKVEGEEDAWGTFDDTTNTIEIDDSHEEVLSHEIGHWIYKKNYGVAIGNLMDQWGVFNETTNQVDWNPEDEYTKPLSELFGELQQYYISKEFLSWEYFQDKRPLMTRQGKDIFLTTVGGKNFNYFFSPAEVFSRAVEAYVDGEVSHPIFSQIEGTTEYLGIIKRWGDKYLRTGIIKSFVILEKAKQVQVKPYQRKGKYVIGYQRTDPRTAKLSIGDRVKINSKDSWLHGEWGIVTGVDGDLYHVAPWGDHDQSMVFYRSELRFSVLSQQRVSETFEKPSKSKPYREIGEKQKAFAKKFEGQYNYDPENEVLIGRRYPIPVPRYYYHRPPRAEASREGIKAYINRNLDGSTEAIEREFQQKEPKIVWLSSSITYGAEATLKVDLAQLDPLNLRLTGQAEGNIWHLGDIPESAIMRNRLKISEAFEKPAKLGNLGDIRDEGRKHWYSGTLYRNTVQFRDLIAYSKFNGWKVEKVGNIMRFSIVPDQKNIYGIEKPEAAKAEIVIEIELPEKWDELGEKNKVWKWRSTESMFNF